MKIGLGIGIPRQQSSSGGGVSFDTDYQALLDAASGDLPSASVQTAQNTLVVDLKAAGVWDKLDLFYVFATDGGDDIRRRNWKVPASFQVSLVSSPTFTSLEGYTTGSGAYINTGFDPSTNGSTYTLNDASIHYYSRTVAGENGVGIGSGTTVSSTDATFLNVNAANSMTGRINSNNILVNPVTNNAGLSSVSRSGSSTALIYKNGSLLTTESFNVAVSLSVYDFYIGGFNGAGSLASNVARQFSIIAAGGDLSMEMTAFFTAVEKYMDAIGKGVVA